MDSNKQFREELISSVDTLTDEQLNQELEEGRWTIAQVLEHLYLMERTITKRIAAALAKEGGTEPEEKPIQLAVNRSRKVDAPEYVTPSSELKTLHELIEKLGESRQELMDVVNGADEAALRNRSLPHPVFGELSLKQWIPFIGYHEKRHLEQIEELKVRLIN
ncbi:DinB family protein [Peribacillus sp. SCS-37]|uniref:DinB family protein n=1 Tax=Paraperibacillus esterisolvens TaxID=3115296 RepID=UPI0039059F7E